MKKMIALYNGMGCGAAAAIAEVELVKQEPMDPVVQTIAVIGA
jgi:hypothetical protein